MQKIDEQNYVIIDVDGQGRITTRAVFLHNTKVASSKMGEDKERAKYDGMIQGRCISLMEMMHVMLKYPEVYTNMRFISIPTMPLELRAGVVLDTNSNEEDEDGEYITSASDSIRQSLQLDKWRQHTPNQILIMDDLKMSNVSIDKVTQFSMRPPEFIGIIDSVRDYFRWFHI